MVGGDMLFKRELIEQRSLFDLPMSHHDLQPSTDISAPQQPTFSTKSAGVGIWVFIWSLTS
jgi:hypothetical protein